MPSTKVLLLGHNPELLWLREAVLRCAGFEVLTSLDLQDGLAIIQGGDCGVLLLCYSLPFLSRKQLADTFRANCPEGRIVTITNEKSAPEFADLVVYGVDGPEALIDAIRTA
jgi:DNA-binding response OmpR family regulator